MIELQVYENPDGSKVHGAFWLGHADYLQRTGWDPVVIFAENEEWARCGLRRWIREDVFLSGEDKGSQDSDGIRVELLTTANLQFWMKHKTVLNGNPSQEITDEDGLEINLGYFIEQGGTIPFVDTDTTNLFKGNP